ncbi:sugar phosphate isomerase/epimerase [Mycolicibacterium sp. P9-64]|uniref:sugar phosphate isomerase/epimerase family protein n=1 Tax=Mycolicibacterium sp. P9-64 TaxID=2024612 RepID=UPI0011EECAA3|nr:sugar phosphate isomerase/epimerase family protein [Mycolicibacterium sp. P9-64]KAA0081776.1 sugar phosphate isomerase/epimerase [Mycolicibacterium sp. P9-64]
MTAHPRMSLNQATIKHAGFHEAVKITMAEGIPSIGLWREPVAGVGLAAAVEVISDSGLRVSSLCRGGFFTADDPDQRRVSIDDNRRAIDEAAVLARAGALGSAAVLVLVPGGLPEGSTDIAGARARVRDAVGVLVDDAAAAGVVLAIEPMHPIYAADRGVISTLGQALDIAEDFPADVVGVVVDAFHVWWDPELLTQVARAGANGRIASYQVNDWITPLPPDALLARGVTGDGHIDLPGLTAAVCNAGYRGDVEVEVFNKALWDMPFADAAALVAERFSAIGLG